MNVWIFVFVFAGKVFSTPSLFTEDECRVMLEVTKAQAASCINIERPSRRIHLEKP